MMPLVLLSAEGKRSSKYFPNSASMASSRVAVMRKRYNRLFYRVLGIMHVRMDPTAYRYRTAVEYYPWRTRTQAMALRMRRRRIQSRLAGRL